MAHKPELAMQLLGIVPAQVPAVRHSKQAIPFSVQRQLQDLS